MSCILLSISHFGLPPPPTMENLFVKYISFGMGLQVVCNSGEGSARFSEKVFDLCNSNIWGVQTPHFL